MNKSLLKESHRRQFEGEDWQKVVNEICERNGFKWGEDEYEELATSPEPGCDCGFCKTADWQD